MRKFRFGLQRVLDYRETIEEKLLAELAAIRVEHDREMIRLMEITNARNLFREKMKKELSGGDPDDIKQAYHYLSELGRQVRAQEQAVRRIAERKDRKTAEVVEASKDRKILERLRERKQFEHRREVESQEQKFLDDIAGIRHERRRSKYNSAPGGQA